MPQPTTNTHHTAKDLSPDELAKYRKRLDQQLRERNLDPTHLQHAWQTAHQIAAMLYRDFGATQIAVFGSLAEETWFSVESDIDIVVWGLPCDIYQEALWETRNFSQTFKIDLVNFSSTTGRFRERIQAQAVFIQKSETGHTGIRRINGTVQIRNAGNHDPMNKQKLIERILDEREKIEKTVEEIKKRLKKMETASTEEMEDLKVLVAMRLSLFYTGLEKIFQRIAREIDTDEPQGKDWHKDLLEQMGTSRPARPAVISEEMVAALTLILRFRHRARHIYVFELEPERTAENGQRVCELFDTLSAQLDAFIAYLRETA